MKDYKQLKEELKGVEIFCIVLLISNLASWSIIATLMQGLQDVIQILIHK